MYRQWNPIKLSQGGIFFSLGADWGQEESLSDGCRYLWCFIIQICCLCLISSGCDPHSVTLNPTLARLQAPEAAADKKSDQLESDTASQEASIHTPSPRRNGSITNFQSPVCRGNSIRTITQSASRTDLNRGTMAGSVRSPTVTILPKHRLEHIPNRSYTHTHTHTHKYFD